jgi:FMN-dependent NADH-azoreductase
VKILHLDSSITGDQSVTRQLSARIVRSLDRAGTATTSHRDLAKEPLPHLSFAPEASVAHAASLDEFLAADVVVVGAPMYNFTIPSQLKSWIDSIQVAGKTFRYTANGPEGLVGGKRVIIASSRGGAYSEGPMSALDHQEAYLRQVFAFIGIDVEIVRAEGVAREDSRQSALDTAFAHADSLGAVAA